MTEAQKKLYWREWGAVRRAFPKADRDDITIKALGARKSHLDFSNRDFDLVLGAFRALTKPCLKGQLRQDTGDTRRLMHRISETQAMLGVYIEDVAGYVATVLADKFGVPVGGSKTIEDLNDKPRSFWNARTKQRVELPSELMQLQMTLWARLNALRKKQGHTLCQVASLANVPCRCTSCQRKQDPRHAPVAMGDADEVVGELIPAGEGEPF
jgi:hypothetical protein